MIFEARTVTVSAAETNALNTKPAAGAAGKPNDTALFTAAPATVMVKSSEAVVAIEAKFKVAEAPNTAVNFKPLPAVKPFVEIIGPLKVVDMIFSFLHKSLISLCNVRWNGLIS